MAPLLTDCGQFSIVVEDKPAVYADSANNVDEPGRTIRADGKAEYVFTGFCESEAHVPSEPEDPDTFAPAPPIDPGFDEFDPEGPQPGPPGAEPVDRP